MELLTALVAWLVLLSLSVIRVANPKPFLAFSARWPIEPYCPANDGGVGLADF